MATTNNPENKQLPHEGNNLGQIIKTPSPEDLQYKFGRTTEGFGFGLIMEYEPGAHDGAAPIRITGSYTALDGGGDIDVTDWQDLPAVITDSADF